MRCSTLDFGRETRLVPENLFLDLVGRDRRCGWPGCTICPTWCDAHHIVLWAPPANGRTSDDNCVLLCHRHHQLAHQPGWSVTGHGTELVVEHPDGSKEVSRPPGAGPPDTSGHPNASGSTDPPGSADGDAPRSTFEVEADQLTLA